MHQQLSQDQLYVTVDLLILTVKGGKLQLLLSRREKAPYARRWALPGRFVGVDESAETAAQILLNEMLPVTNAYLEQLYTFSDVNRDPRGRVISMAYLVIVPWERLKKQMEESESGFQDFTVRMDENGLRLEGSAGDILVPSDLAFDHGRIIETGILRLRGKLDYTVIGFRFLENPKAFSLSELQTIYESVLGEKVDGSNFRRAILMRYERSGQLVQTDQAEKKGRGRPAVLYTMKF